MKYYILVAILLLSACSREATTNDKTTINDGDTNVVETVSLTIAGIVPSSGSLKGGTPAVLRGSGFVEGLAITVGGNNVIGITVESPMEVSFFLPKGDGLGPKEIRVVNPDGTIYSLTGGYKYVTAGQFVMMGFKLPPKDDISNTIRSVDIDKDGDLDMFIANDGLNRLIINEGEGRFSELSVLFNENHEMTSDAKFGDLDGDDDIDIIAVNDFSGAVTIYDNEGDGTFTAKAFEPVTRGCAKGVEIGDINDDGNLDILVINYFSNDCPEITRLFLNFGEEFMDVTAENLPEGLGARYRSTGAKMVDVNGDNLLDIIITNLAQPDKLYLNRGNGMFNDASSSLPQIIADSTSVDTGDVDLDGDIDIIIFTLDEELLYLNDGNGNFIDGSSKLPTISDRTWDGKLIDVDNDADLDIIKINNGQNSLYLNNGIGRFSDFTESRMPEALGYSKGLETGDFNGDGYTDLLIANAGNSGQQNRIYFGNGQGLFTDATGHLPVDNEHTKDLAIADINSDGYLDIVFADYSRKIKIMAGQGNRIFVEAELTGLPGLDAEDKSYEAVTLVDIDGDLDMDLFVVTQESHKLYENKSLGNISFSDITETNLGTKQPGESIGMDAAAGDIDNDGDMDIVVAAMGKETIWLNTGDGQFTDDTARRLPPEETGNTSSASVLLVDLNNDDFLDIVLSNNNLSSLDANKQNRLYLNRGKFSPGIFDDVTTSHLPAAIDDDTMEIAAADLNGDGFVDLVIANDNFGDNCGNKLYLNDGYANFTDATPGRLVTNCESSKGVVLLDIEGDGDTDIVFANEGQDLVYLNDSSAFFAAGSADNLPLETDKTLKMIVSDIDKDGDPDIVTAVHGQSKIYVNVNE